MCIWMPFGSLPVFDILPLIGPFTCHWGLSLPPRSTPENASNSHLFGCTEWLHVKVSCIRGQHEPSRKITRQVPELETFTSHFWPVNRSEIWVSDDKAGLSWIIYTLCSQHDFITPTKWDQTLPWGDYSVQKRWPTGKGVHILNSQSNLTFVVPRVLY